VHERTINTAAGSETAMISDPPPTPFERAKAELRQFGIELISQPGAYRFRYVGQDAAAPFLPGEAEDLAQAMELGQELAKSPRPQSLPPLGPLGRAKSRRGAMIRHNRKIAARRRKRKPRTDKTS